MGKPIESTAGNTKKVLFHIAVALVVIGLGIGALGCRSDPVSLSTHFAYSDEELEPLRSSRSDSKITVEDVLEWEDRLFDLVNEEKIKTSAVSKILPYLVVAQRDAAYLSFNTHHKFMGSIDPVSRDVSCIFIPDVCRELPVDTDAYSEKLAEIVMLRVNDRISAAEAVRRGIRNMLEQSDGVTVVGEAGDGEDAIEKIRTLVPDVVLMDIQMPKLDGVETVRRLRALGLEPQVILLSVYDRDEYIFEGLRAGARGYLLKDVAEEDLVRAIKTVHGGGSLLQPVIAKRLIDRLDSEARPHLTERELEVLQLLASGARNKEIADQLTLSVRTVRFHVENIYQKLGARNRTQAVRVASESGLLNS